MMDRDFLAQVAIVLAVCIGGWMMLVDPAATEIRTLEAEIDAARGVPDTTAQSALEAHVARVSTIKQRLAEIEAANAIAEQPDQLYGVIMDRAADHGVTVHRLQPGQPPDDAEDAPFEVTRFDMTVEGEYEAVADFIAAVDRTGGFLRPQTLQVSTVEREGRPLVTARFGCEALRFSCGDVVAQMEDARDGQP
ncbi:MAG: hypothetical protein ACYTG1_07265 [Planctomycetota bacterium]|jgi:Tfp pilus assembly protein PilO